MEKRWKIFDLGTFSFVQQLRNLSSSMSKQKRFFSRQVAETACEDGFYHDTIILGFFLRVRNNLGNSYLRRHINGKRYEINLGAREKVKFQSPREMMDAWAEWCFSALKETE